MRRTRIAILPLFVALLTVPLATVPLAAQEAEPAQDARLTLDRYLDWERADDPQVSPDGSRIIYSRARVDQVHDRWTSELWIMEADGSRNRFLAEGSSPRWSPDGRRIAYLADGRGEDEGRQLFVRWMDAEGATSQLTHVEESPSDIRWSPDGERIAFTMEVEDAEPWSVDLPERPDGAEWTQSPRIITRMDYRQDRVGFAYEAHDHIFVVPAEGGTPRRLTDGRWDHDDPEWTPDGREILFSSLRTEDAEHQWRESEVYAVEVDAQAGSPRIRRLTSRRGPDHNAVPSPDGSLIAYTGEDFHEDTYSNESIYVMRRDGSGARSISGDFDRGLRGGARLMWAPDGSGVYFNVESEGTENLYFAAVDGGVRAVTEGEHVLSVESISDDGRAVGTRETPHRPGDVVVFELDRPDDRRRLTRVNDDVLAGIELGDVEEIRYSSADGLEIQGWIVTPPDFDPSREYPLMLSIHGGPHSMYDVGFSFGWQNHAANGYVVLYTNPRGSSGYGSAFGNEIDNAYPGGDYDDLMAGVDAVIERGYIDTDNMFVYGCSGGGVLTSWVVGHTDRFAAASANCPVTDWFSFVGTTDSPNWYHNFENHPWEDPSEHLRRSPLMYVGNVTTPTMLMTGENDLRTPISQTEEFYQALKVLDVPTAMLRFRNEWHGTSSTPSNFLRTQLYLRSWFERWGDRGTTMTESASAGLEPDSETERRPPDS